MKRELLEEKLVAYLDDELSGEERRAVEEALAASPELREKVRLLQATARAVRSRPFPAPSPALRAAIRERLARERAARAPRRAVRPWAWLRPSWRWSLATAVVAALVAGIMLWSARTVTAEEVIAEALRAWQHLDHLHLRARWISHLPAWIAPKGQLVGECEQWFQRPDKFREEGTLAWPEEGVPARVKVVNGNHLWLWVPSAKLLFVRERMPFDVDLNLGPLGEDPEGQSLEDCLRTALAQSQRRTSEVKIEKLPAEHLLERECDVVEVRYLKRRKRYWFDRETHILLRQETWESGDPLQSYEVHLFDQQPPEPRLFMPPKGADLRLVRLPVSNEADSDFRNFWLLYTRLEPHWFEAATAGPEAQLQAALAKQLYKHNVPGPGGFLTNRMFYPTKLPEGYEFLGSEFLKFFKRDDREVRALFLHHDGYTLDTLTFAQSPAARPETHRGVAATVHDLPARYGEEPGVFPLRWITWEEDGNRLTLRASGLSREDLLKLAEAVRSRPRKEIQQDPRQVISVDNFSEAAVQVPFLLFTPTWWPQPDYNMHRYLQISRHRLLPELEETPRVTLYLDRTSDADGNPISRSEGEWGEIRFEQWPAPGVPRPPERIPTEAIAIHDRLGWFYEEKPFPHRLARSVFWAERGTALALHSNRLTREQLLKMAESVKPATEAEVAPAMDTRIAQRMQAAIKALEARDADALYAVSHPQERAELNVTRATLRRLLSEIFAQMGPLQARAIVERTSSRCSEAQWVVEWEPASGAARSRLPQGAPTRPFIAVAQGGVAPGHEWAVKVTKSLYWLCQRALGLGRGTEAYIRACRKSGIGGILDSEGRLRRVEELEQELRDRKKAEQAARQRTAQDLATPEAASPGLQKKHPLQK